MKKHRMLLSTVLLILALGTVASQFAQDISRYPTVDEKRSLLIGLVRTINTAEVMERDKYGSYGSWRKLLEHQEGYLNPWLGKFYSADANVHFGDTPEILPGWNLR
jgi:hypothetical protein